MINVSLENETDWIVRGTVTSDVSEINLEDDEFRIELKDLLEHYIKRNKSAEMVESYQKDSTQTLSISNNEVKLVPLKCPICKGSGLAVDNYPMGRIPTNIKPNGNKGDKIYQVNNGMFVNPITQLPDYSNVPSILFPYDSGYAPYTSIENTEIKQYLTYYNYEDIEDILYNIIGTNEYYYYTFSYIVEGSTPKYFVCKRQKFEIKKQYVLNENDLPISLNAEAQADIANKFYGNIGEKLWYVKNNPTKYYYYQKVLGGYILKENCYYCQIGNSKYSSGEDPNAHTICDGKQKQILAEEFYSNVSTYNNSDMKSLIENGFQFWISEDKKELNFRLTMRGKSSINPNGYEDKLKTKLYNNELYSSATGDIVDEGTKTLYSGRVGFTLAICSISLDATHRICFNITIAPTFKSSDIFRVDNDVDNISQIPTKPYKVCPVCNGTQYQLNYSAYNGSTISFVQERYCNTCSSGDYYMDRYAYPYYNAKKFDNMIFLNNHSATYSSTYDTYWKNNKYETSSINEYINDDKKTNLYAAYTSAIIPAYLVSGSTIDVLSPTPTYTTGVRSFEFCYDEGVVSSYLLDSDKSKYCELPWTNNEIQLKNFVYVEENGACIYDDLNVNLIRQDIDVGKEGVTIDDMVGKTVFFGTEV